MGDPAHPTTFQVDPLHPTDCYRRMDCGGFQHAPDFRLYMDPEQAPESCGSFYWDPLVHAVAGDGFGASAIASGGGDSRGGDSRGGDSRGGDSRGGDSPGNDDDDHEGEESRGAPRAPSTWVLA